MNTDWIEEGPIWNIRTPQAYIISPGVGKQGGDGKKTLEYSNAIIVGRSIYESDNPKLACENLIKSLEQK